jgi:PD-(D/E)XK nuclease superfamily protein
VKFSFSRERCLRRCQRQFYFRDIAAWHNARDPLRREAYVLKQLKTLELWQGQLVHRAIEKWVIPALQNKGAADWDGAVADAIVMAERQLAFSAARRYRDRALTKSVVADDFCALLVHEFGQGISEAEFQTVKSVVERALRNLADLEGFWREARNRGQYFAELPLRTSYEGSSVEGHVDLMFFRGPGRPTIVDWKVSEAGGTDARVQTSVYAWLLSRSPIWRVSDPVEVELLEVRLLDREVIKHRLSEADFADLEDRLYCGISDMKELIGEGGYTEIDLAEFAYANSPGTCALCPFRRLCLDSGVPNELPLAQLF